MKSKIFIFLIMLLASCSFYYPPRDFVKQYEFCYTPRQNDDSLFLKNGFYYFTKDTNEIFKQDTSQALFYYIFYQNGICARFACYLDIYETIDEIILKDLKNERDYFYRNITDWGTYYVKDNKIIAEYMSSNGMGLFNIYVIKFEIIDKNTLITREYIVKSPNYPDKIAIASKLYCNFEPNNKMPLPKGWILKRSWFWCDKKEYRAYKQSLKQ